MFLERHQQKVIDATSLSLNDENLYENIALNYQDRTLVKPTEGTRKSIPLMQKEVMMGESRLVQSSLNSFAARNINPMSSTLHPKFTAYGQGINNFGGAEHNFTELKLN